VSKGSWFEKFLIVSPTKHMENWYFQNMHLLNKPIFTMLKV